MAGGVDETINIHVESSGVQKAIGDLDRLENKLHNTQTQADSLSVASSATANDLAQISPKNLDAIATATNKSAQGAARATTQTRLFSNSVRDVATQYKVAEDRHRQFLASMRAAPKKGLWVGPLNKDDGAHVHAQNQRRAEQDLRDAKERSAQAEREKAQAARAALAETRAQEAAEKRLNAEKRKASGMTEAKARRVRPNEITPSGAAATSWAGTGTTDRAVVAANKEINRQKALQKRLNDDLARSAQRIGAIESRNAKELAELNRRNANAQLQKDYRASGFSPDFRANRIAQLEAERDSFAKGSLEAARAEEKLRTETNLMSKAFDEQQSSLSNTRYALYDVSAAYTGIAAIATAVAAVPVNFAMDFEKEFAQVIRTADLTGDTIDTLRQEFIDMSTFEMPTSFTDLSEIGALGGQLGIAKEDIKEFTSVVGRLSETSDLTSEAAGTMIGRFQALNNVNSTEFENLASAVLEVGVNSMATESDIANVALQISSMGNMAGMTADEVVGLAGGMASLGVAPELSRSVITKMFTDIDKAINAGGERLQKFADVASVSADEFKNAWGTDQFTDMFMKLLAGIGSAGADAGQVITDLGLASQRNTPIISRMAQGLGTIELTMIDSAEGWEKGTTLVDQYGIIASTTAARLDMFQNSLSGLMATLGQQSNSVFGGLLSAMTEIVSAVQKLVNTPVAGWVAGIGVGVAAVTALRTAWGALRSIVIASSLAIQTALGAGPVVTKSMTAAVLDLGNAFRTLSGTTTANTTATTANTTAKNQNAVATRGLSASAVSANSAITSNTAVLGANTAASGLASRAKAGLGGAMSALGSVLSKGNIAIGLVIGGISLLGNALSRHRADAENAAMAQEEFQSAIIQDTRAFETSGQAMATYSRAWTETNGEVTNSLNTATQAFTSEEAATQQAARAKQELANKTGVSTEEIKTQTFYLGENTRALMEQKLLSGDTKTAIEDLATQWAAMGDNAPGSIENFMRDLATDGDAAAQTITDIRLEADGLSSDMGQLNLVLTELHRGESLERALDLVGASESTRTLVDAFHDLDRAAQIDSVNELLNGMTEQAGGLYELADAADTVTPLLSVAKDEVSAAALAADASSAYMEGLSYTADNAADSMDYLGSAAGNSALMVQGASIDSMNALFGFGQALATNGMVFDMYSQAGRANLGAMMQFAQAAASESGASASTMANHAMMVMQSLVDAGMQAADALKLVNSVFGAVATNAGMDWVDVSMPKFNTFSAGVKSGAINMGDFNRTLQEGYNAAMKNAKGTGNAGRSAKNAGDKAKKAGDKGKKAAKEVAKEVRTLTDYVKDLDSVMSSAFDIRWGMDKSVDSVAEAWQKLRDHAEDAADAIQQAKDDMEDANKTIRDARQDLREINAELAELYAERDILEFQYRVAVEYGDTLRANEIKADLGKNSADISSKKNDKSDATADIDTGNADLAKATKELSQAQIAARRDLSGTTESAREQRDGVWNLIESYQEQIVAYANTGASQEQVKAYSEKLRGEFVNQLTQMGYNRAEVNRYSQSFRDMKVVIDRVPKNLTVRANADPAIRAFNEFASKAKRASDRAAGSLGGVNKGLGNVRNNAGRAGGALGGIKTPRWNTKATNDFAWAVKRVADNLYKVRDGYIKVETVGKRTRAYVPGGMVALGYSQGGLVPGGPGANMIDWRERGTDTVPAMLTPGEFVLKKSAVDALGVPFLKSLNEMKHSTPVTVPSRSGGGNGPAIQLVELMPYQMSTIVGAVSRNVVSTISGGDMSRATTVSNRRAERAGVN